MRRIKRLLSVVSAGILSMSSLFVLLAPVAHAAQDICTWNGLANSNFSDAGNWTCSIDVLEPGDDLVFPSIVTNRNVTMDVAYSVADVDFNGDMIVPCGASGYVISGANALTVTGLINLNHTGTCVSGAEQTISAPFTVGGNIVVDGSLSDVTESLDLTGSTVTGSNPIVARVTVLKVENINSSVGLSIEDGAELSYTVADCSTAVISSAVSLANSASLTVQDSSDDCEDVTITNVSLSLDSELAAGYRTVTVTNLTANGYVFTVTDGSATTVIAGGNTIVGGYVDLSHSANAPVTPLTITEKERATVSGTYGATTVNALAYLKGTGTVGALNVQTGGFLAPGNSPGCLNTGNLTLAGTYEVEVQGATACTGYDQTNVTGTVNLTGGTLDVATTVFVPTVGQTFTIINNDLAEAVTGTFTGLAEGATIVDGGVTYTISYIGGDGNDVVLTVTAVDASAIPGAPNTGFAILTSNPLATLLGGLLAAAGFGLLARRQFARVQ